MKLIECLRARQAQKQLRQAQKLRRQFESLSRDPKGTGWFKDEANPNRIYILGYSLTLDPEKVSYTLAYLEDQYVALKADLVRSYPDFVPTRARLEVEVFYASTLVTDADLLARTTPCVRTHHYVDDWNTTVDKLDSLDVPVVLDGDTVTLSISPGSYYQGYGFYVYDHPDSRDGEGLWCRPIPDTLAALSGEKTR